MEGLHVFVQSREEGIDEALGCVTAPVVTLERASFCGMRGQKPDPSGSCNWKRKEIWVWFGFVLKMQRLAHI